MSEALFPVLDEQTVVGFTGKVNILNVENNQHLGLVSILDGEIFDARFGSNEGLQAFYNICVASFSKESNFKFIVEPEIVEGVKKIHFPYSVLKKKVADIISLYKENEANRPPDHIKLLINPHFITMGGEVSGDEFELLCSISDYNKVKDIYKNCELLDYQITNALVSLRKKKAITVVKKK